MKKFLKDKRFIITILLIFGFWRMLLVVPQLVGTNFIPQHPGFVGPIPWANLDGLHYLSIAQEGYSQYEQAFFPLFPLLINSITRLFNISYLESSIYIVHFALFFSLILFWKLTNLDYDKKTSIWILLFFLSFPTSFFLASIYTESLFTLFLIASFYFARKKRWLLAGLIGGLASATKLVGVFIFPILIIEFILQERLNIALIQSNVSIYVKKIWGIIFVPAGLLSYMYYLADMTGDPLNFIHSQPAFGAGRSGGEIILIPQVLWRYLRILTTVSLSNYDFWIALLELTIFIFVLTVLYFAYKNGIRKTYILFSLIVIFLPTLSGTLSSIPRYALASFAIFIFFATIKNKIFRYTILFCGIILEVILSALYLRGYFVS